MSFALKLADRIIGGGNDKPSKELGAGFFTKLQKYKAGTPENYDSQFMGKLRKYESLNNTTVKFGEGKTIDQAAQNSAAAKARGTGTPGVAGVAWYWIAGGAALLIGLIVFIPRLFTKKRRR